MTGLLIAFEGLDGSGLSTQANLLRNYLAEKVPVILTKEQTDGSIGGLIKSSLRDEFKTSPLALQLLFAADRAHHLATEIEPALKEGKTVICDRYILSSIAFGSLGVDMEFMKEMNSKFREPDLTFIIDTEPKECLERIKRSRFHLELFEDEEKFIEIRKNFLSIKDMFSNTHIIDGNRKIEEVFEDIKKPVDKIL